MAKCLQIKTFAVSLHHNHTQQIKSTQIQIFYQMKNPAINPELLSDNNTFKFRAVSTMPNGFTDVFYKGQRIAILNGLSAPLQWTAKNGSNIPVKVIEQLEKMAAKLIKKTASAK